MIEMRVHHLVKCWFVLPEKSLPCLSVVVRFVNGQASFSGSSKFSHSSSVDVLDIHVARYQKVL